VRSEPPAFRDSWGNQLKLEPTRWFASNNYYVLRSAGPDGKLNTSDDLQAFLFFERKRIAGAHAPSASRMGINIEHDRGPFNGKAEIVGTVADPTGAVIANASIEVREITTNRVLKSTTDGQGQFRIAAATGFKFPRRVFRPLFETALCMCGIVRCFLQDWTWVLPRSRLKSVRARCFRPHSKQ
jgi:Carboxypeptidase regulatory-like domain